MDTFDSTAFPPGASCLLPCPAARRVREEHSVLVPFTTTALYTPVRSSMVWQQSGKGYRPLLMATAAAVVAGLTMATGNAVVAEMVIGGGGGGGRRHEGKQRIRAAWAGSSRADTAFPLSHLHFCLGCPDPGAEGSLGEINKRLFFIYRRRHRNALSNVTLQILRCTTCYVLAVL